MIGNCDSLQSPNSLPLIQRKFHHYLNRLTNSVSSAGGSNVVSFRYVYNNANQRTSVTNVDGSYWVYQYDDLGQVTSGRKYWSDASPVAGQQFTYGFDDIGNRETAASGGNNSGTDLQSSSYTANLLNQYSSRTVPDVVGVSGTATNTATVTVNFEPTERKGDYWWGEAPAENVWGPLWLGITNIAVLDDAPNADIIATNFGHVYVPQSPEAFTYDDDGNLTGDSLWTNTWNGENRRTTIESRSGVPAAGKMREQWTYLPDGRWVERIVSTNNGSGYYPAYTNRYVWDGNVLLAVMDDNGNVLQRYSHGLSGLLWMSAGTNGTHFACIDGNANVMALVDASDSSESARYEYGPLSENTRATGPMAQINSIRFSTQYADDVTGDRKYKYRDYRPDIGRWISRDPMEEHGGVNAYVFVDNNSVNTIDLLGLAKGKVRYVGKSFINGIGPLGSLGNRAGLPFPSGLLVVGDVDLGTISGDGQYADQRLRILASLVGGLAAFNQLPTTDAKDGQYRLYGKIEIKANCCGSILRSYSYDTDMEGGNELPGINGTINMDVDDGRGAWGFSLTSATVTWKTWGRPNLIAEFGLPGMQWVAYRTSVNIWHEGKVKITCSGGKPIFTVLSFRGSRYPSRRLWENGVLIRSIRQGSFSDLWNRQSLWEPTMVAE